MHSKYLLPILRSTRQSRKCLLENLSFGCTPRAHQDCTEGFTDDKWWKEKRAYSKWEAWVDMIQLAQWKATEITTTKFGSIRLERGEFVLSQRAMAKRWGWSRQSVRTFTESPAFPPA
jgi:hypothetical protein